MWEELLVLWTPPTTHSNKGIIFMFILGTIVGFGAAIAFKIMYFEKFTQLCNFVEDTIKSL